MPGRRPTPIWRPSGAWPRRAQLPEGWEAELPTFTPKDELATRKSGEKVIAAVAQAIPWFFGGDADLSVSTLTDLKDGGDFDGQTGAGRNIRYGVREHAMGAAANGITYHGGTRTFTATFFTFADYERPALRLAALSHLPVAFVFTHDSIGLGEDGPTHQPIEQLASLRAMPAHVGGPPGRRQRGGRGLEAGDEPQGRAHRHRAQPPERPHARSQQSTPRRSGVQKGGYVLADARRRRARGDPDRHRLRAVSVAVGAQDKLAAEGIRARVVSLPCWEVFASQDQAYRDSVLPPSITARVSVEAGATFGWSQVGG